MTLLARAGVARFLARRLAQAVPTVLVIIVINFLVLHLTPGDIVDVLAGEAGAATPEYVAMLRQRFGLDRPLVTQLASYVWGVVNLDLGFSFRHNTTLLHLVLDPLPAPPRLMRPSMLEVAGQDYVRTARAKGISETRVLYGHALRNALLPLVTVVGVQVGSLLGGSVLVESVFGWPGLGRLAFEAVQQRDYNVLLGILFMSSLLVIAINLAVDLLYAVLDPRIEVR